MPWTWWWAWMEKVRTARVLPGRRGDCSRTPGLSLDKIVMYGVIRGSEGPVDPVRRKVFCASFHKDLNRWTGAPVHGQESHLFHGPPGKGPAPTFVPSTVLQ